MLTTQYQTKFLFLIALTFFLLGCASSPKNRFHVILGAKNWGYNTGSTPVVIVRDLNVDGLQIRQIKVSTPGCTSGVQDVLELNGKINEDTSFVVEKILSEISPCADIKGQRYVTPVYMNSDGGKLVDGYSIGEAFSKYGVKAIVAPGQSCASSCAIAFLKAKFRQLHDGGELLFHAPYRAGSFNRPDCSNDDVNSELKGYYLAAIGDVAGKRLYDRTMKYCSRSEGWTVNKDAALLYGITTE